MGALLTYSLAASVVLLSGYLTYKLFMAREKQPVINRAALLLIYAAAGLALPLLQKEWGRSVPGDAVIELGDLVVTVASEPAAVDNQLIPRVLLAVYLTGAAVVGLFTIYALARLWWIVSHGSREQWGDYTLVCVKGCEVPFSFGSYMVMGEEPRDEIFTMMAEHEMAHLRHRHWLDLVLAQIACIVMWYNPASWLMRREMRQIHEYQADEAVVNNGHDPYEYQMLLIKKAAGRRLQSLANSLNHSNLYKRITMMYKSKKRAGRSVGALALVPAIALAVIAVKQPAIATTFQSMGSATLIPEDAIVTEALHEVTEKSVDVQVAPSAEISESSEISVVACRGKLKEPVSDDSKVEIMEVSDLKVLGSRTLRKLPQFPGGEAKLIQFLIENIIYPEDALKDDVKGRVLVNFTVDVDGSIKNAQVVKSVSKSLDDEALRVVSILPNFEPGLDENGKPVALVYTLPVNFSTKSDSNEDSHAKVQTTVVKIHGTEAGQPSPAVFINGELSDGNLSNIPAKKIQSVTIDKNNPEYPGGLIKIELHD